MWMGSPRWPSPRVVIARSEPFGLSVVSTAASFLLSRGAISARTIHHVGVQWELERCRGAMGVGAGDVTRFFDPNSG